VLAAGLFYLAGVSSANAFDRFERMLGGSAQKGYGCDCGKEMACGMETSCGCGSKHTRCRHHRLWNRGCGCDGGVYQKGGDACQKGGAYQKDGAAQKGGASQKDCGAAQKGGIHQKGCGCGGHRMRWHGRGCGCNAEPVCGCGK
jgi:hypothetical protein